MYILIFFISTNLYAQIPQIKTGLYVGVDSNYCKLDQTYFTLNYLSNVYCFKNKPDISVEDFDTLAIYPIKINNEAIFSMSIKLTNSATSKFENITSNNIGNKIAFIAENKIIMIPTVNGEISSGVITIQDSEKVILELEKYLQSEMKKINAI